jgi:hypothetical protein
MAASFRHQTSNHFSAAKPRQSHSNGGGAPCFSGARPRHARLGPPKCQDVISLATREAAECSDDAPNGWRISCEPSELCERPERSEGRRVSFMRVLGSRILDDPEPPNS